MKCHIIYGNVKSYTGHMNNWYKAERFLSYFKIQQKFDFLVITKDKNSYTIEFGNDVDFEEYVIEKTKHILYCLHQHQFAIEPKFNI